MVIALVLFKVKLPAIFVIHPTGLPASDGGS